jgi:predicted dehydrogenase
MEALMIGAGNRGRDVYGDYALKHPERLKFIAVAEPDDARMESFAKQHCIPENMIFKSYRELLDRPKLCETAFVCTQDRLHYEPVIMALKEGYNILLEKPISTNLKECLEMLSEIKKSRRSVTVAHVLRYTPFFSKVKEIIESGVLGELVSIRLSENIGYYHYAHSFVRGNWRNSDLSSPMILAKSCHDMDILIYLTGKRPLKVSSFGSLKHFKRENAPEFSSERCLGCMVENSCPYSAIRIYLGENTDWPVSVITNDLSMEGRVEALREGPYGRCVYRCDNNVVDHQIVNIEFENDINASFVMCGFTHETSRDIRVMGTLGQLDGKLEENSLELGIFGGKGTKTIRCSVGSGCHSGGDGGLMDFFTEKKDSNESRTSAEESTMSHVLAFAAEESRLSGRVVDFDKFAEAYYSSK